MANTKISALTAATALDGTEVAPIVQAGATVKATAQQILNLATGAVAVSTPVINQSQTWNAGGVTFTGWKLNITDTASASGSLMVDLQVAGSSVFKVRKDGAVTAGWDIISGNNVFVGGAGGSAIISRAGSASFTFGNGGSNAFTVTGGASGLASFGGPVKTLSTTVASLPSASTAGAGARAFVTDANATTFLSTVAAGGSNKVPVVSDGTNWLIG